MVNKRKSKRGRVLPDGVSERADGRYLYRYQLYGVTHYIYDRDLNELKKKILQTQLDIANGKVKDISNLTLAQWFPQYTERYKVPKLKDSTLHNFKLYYEKYVKDSVIDRMPMRELKRSHVVAHFQELADKKGLATGTLRSLASHLFGAFEQLRFDGVIAINPVTDVMRDVHAKPKKTREALTEAEVQVMIQFLKEDGWQHVYMPLIGIGLSTGLRLGELLGLTWNDVDFTSKMISVNHTLHYRDRGNGGHEFFVTTPKTKNSIRQIPMTEEVVELYVQQKKYLKDMRLRQDIKIDGYKGFVFVTSTGLPYTQVGFNSSLRRIIRSANVYEESLAKQEDRTPVVLPIHTPHYWRHTFCTRLVDNDVPPELAKGILGHASIKTTLDIYSHITEKTLEKQRVDLTKAIKIL